MAYHIAKTRTVLRVAYNRFLETPALENLLLSSSPEGQILSPAGEGEGVAVRRLSALRRLRANDEEGNVGDEDKGAPVQPSREWQVDTGFQQQLGRYLRLDADFYYRRLKNPPEITNFLETGIIFPANLDHSRSKGIETRLDLAHVRGFSAFCSSRTMVRFTFRARRQCVRICSQPRSRGLPKANRPAVYGWCPRDRYHRARFNWLLISALALREQG